MVFEREKVQTWTGRSPAGDDVAVSYTKTCAAAIRKLCAYGQEAAERLELVEDDAPARLVQLWQERRGFVEGLASVAAGAAALGASDPDRSTSAEIEDLKTRVDVLEALGYIRATESEADAIASANDRGPPA